MGDSAPDAHAASIESDDQTNWTIKLKEGWTFHNGEPVDAASYVRAWNAGALSTNAYGNSYFFENIEGYDEMQAEEGKEPAAKELTGLKVVDDTTFTVQLKAPFSQFPLTVGYNAFFPLPKSYEADPKAYEEQPVGNGPFQMDGAWAHNQAIKVKRFDDYKGTAAKADAVELRIYSDINTAYNDLLAGNLDIMDSVPAGAAGRRRDRVRRPVPHARELQLHLRRVPDVRREVRRPEAASRVLDGHRPSADHRRDLQRLTAAGEVGRVPGGRRFP